MFVQHHLQLVHELRIARRPGPMAYSRGCCTGRRRGIACHNRCRRMRAPMCQRHRAQRVAATGEMLVDRAGELMCLVGRLFQTASGASCRRSRPGQVHRLCAGPATLDPCACQGRPRRDRRDSALLRRLPASKRASSHAASRAQAALRRPLRRATRMRQDLVDGVASRAFPRGQRNVQGGASNATPWQRCRGCAMTRLGVFGMLTA